MNVKPKNISKYDCKVQVLKNMAKSASRVKYPDFLVLALAKILLPPYRGTAGSVACTILNF